MADPKAPDINPKLVVTEAIIKNQKACDHDLRWFGNQHNCDWYRCVHCGFEKKV